jgi:hypothetical protein
VPLLALLLGYLEFVSRGHFPTSLTPAFPTLSLLDAPTTSSTSTTGPHPPPVGSGPALHSSTYTKGSFRGRGGNGPHGVASPHPSPVRRRPLCTPSSRLRYSVATSGSKPVVPTPSSHAPNAVPAHAVRAQRPSAAAPLARHNGKLLFQFPGPWCVRPGWIYHCPILAPIFLLHVRPSRPRHRHTVARVCVDRLPPFPLAPVRLKTPPASFSGPVIDRCPP